MNIRPLILLLGIAASCGDRQAVPFEIPSPPQVAQPDGGEDSGTAHILDGPHTLEALGHCQGAAMATSGVQGLGREDYDTFEAYWEGSHIHPLRISVTASRETRVPGGTEIQSLSVSFRSDSEMILPMAVDLGALPLGWSIEGAGGSSGFIAEDPSGPVNGPPAFALAFSAEGILGSLLLEAAPEPQLSLCLSAPLQGQEGAPVPGQTLRFWVERIPLATIWH